LKLETELHLHSYTIDLVKKDLSIKVTNIFHVPISISKFIKILLLVMWLTWTHIMFFWRDHDNTILMLPTEVKRTSTCSLRRIKELSWGQFHLPQSLHKKRSLRSYSYANDTRYWWNQKKQSTDLFCGKKKKVAPSIEVPEKMKPVRRVQRSCSWRASRRITPHER